MTGCLGCKIVFTGSCIHVVGKKVYLVEKFSFMCLYVVCVQECASFVNLSKIEAKVTYTCLNEIILKLT